MRSFLLFAAFLLIEQSLSLHCLFGTLYKNGTWIKESMKVSEAAADATMCLSEFYTSDGEMYFRLGAGQSFKEECKYHKDGEIQRVFCKYNLDEPFIVPERFEAATVASLHDKEFANALKAMNTDTKPDFEELYEKLECAQETYSDYDGPWKLTWKLTLNKKLYDKEDPPPKVFACTISFDEFTRDVSLDEEHHYKLSHLGKCLPSGPQSIVCYCTWNNCNRKAKEWAGKAGLAAHWKIGELDNVVNNPVKASEETTTTKRTVKEETSSSLPGNPRSNETTGPSIDENPPPNYQTNSDGQRFTKVAFIVASYLVLAI